MRQVTQFANWRVVIPPVLTSGPACPAGTLESVDPATSKFKTSKMFPNRDSNMLMPVRPFACTCLVVCLALPEVLMAPRAHSQDLSLSKGSIGLSMFSFVKAVILASNNSWR